MPKSGSNIKFLILLVITTMIVVIGRVEAFSFFRSPISFVYEPIAYTSFNAAKDVSKWSNALFNAASYITEFENCKNELANLKSLEESQDLFVEENDSLRTQLNLSNSEDQYAIAKIIKYSSDGSATLNVGTKDGVSQDDIVTVGNIFVGNIIQVNSDSSTVRLPTNKSCNYEVAIFPSATDIEKTLKKDTIIKSSAVIKGGVDGIRVENININSDVVDGDIVVLRDERIGQLLVLGRIVSLEDNPASTSKSAFVSPTYDYSNLITVFVKTN